MLTTVIIKKMLSLILACLISMGAISPVGTNQPIKFENSDEIKLSMVLLADTHIRDDKFSAYYFNQMIDDANASEENFDAFIINGDIADNGLKSEYDAVWDGLSRLENADNLILSSGNHDMRFFYDANHKELNGKIESYLNNNLENKDYYSYDVNGYTFIVLGTEKAVFERAYISDKQVEFLDNELSKATAKNNITFVVCHQPLKNTHGLPGVWRTGDLGDQSNKVRDILCKYKNVIYLNGHLHDGIYEKSCQKLADGVYSLNIPAFGKDNDYGKWSDKGLGYIVETYEDKLVFTGRNFRTGEYLDAFWAFDLGDEMTLSSYKY